MSQIPVCSDTTVEDLLNFPKAELKAFLQNHNKAVSGNKSELARRVCGTIQILIDPDTSKGNNHQVPFPVAQGDYPKYETLVSGWQSKSTGRPDVANIKMKDVEEYLINGRSLDCSKMKCFRQFVRGLNFYKEEYIHSIMYNEMSPESELIYFKSKCYPSMKQGVYEQWILMTKSAPVKIIEAYCTCPAGKGEGCTHIAGLLFALEDTSREEEDDKACTSQPCQWNKPSKRKKGSKLVKNIKIRKIKHNVSRTPKKSRNVNYQVDSELFREKMCATLGNDSRAVLFDLLTPPTCNYNPEDDINVGNFEEIDTQSQSFVSDDFISLKCTGAKLGQNVNNFQELMSKCTSEIVQELDTRTRGQSTNHLWKEARKGRITASIFHDVKTKKDLSSCENLTKTILGNKGDFTNLATRWGRKHESIARKQYVAHLKLKGKRVIVQEKGLVISETHPFLGASPDGLVQNDDEHYLIEIKCPYKHRFHTVAEACKDNSFCCYVDKQNKIHLKTSHRYYTQVQGQLGVCQLKTCDFIIYTAHDMAIVRIPFVQTFWDSLLVKLETFYIQNILPMLLSN